MLYMIPLQATAGAEYLNTGGWKYLGLVVLIGIIGGVIWWKRRKAKKLLDEAKDRLK